MACINMFNNEKQGLCNNIGPRISFSNDFADTQQAIKNGSIYKEEPVSSDFEFSAPGFSMITADEIIFKGRLLPSRADSCNKKATMTLRDELLVDDDNYGDIFQRSTKGISRWKERLGLKRSTIVPKKSERTNDGILESIDELKAAELIQEEFLANITGDN